MSEKRPAKVLIRRPSKVSTDDRGRSVWADPIESAELELVSTQTLKQILASSDESGRKSIADLATTVSDGVLARDPATGIFKIIDDDELQEILKTEDNLPKMSRPTDVTLEPLRDYEDVEHLSLVSTMALRKVLKPNEKVEAKKKEEDMGGGFNPYETA